MDIINREQYTDRIRRIAGRGLIIALTGQRRVGKSCIMRQVISDTQEAGANVVYINKENRAFRDIIDADTLLAYVEERLSETQENYLFIDEVQEISGFEHALRSLQGDDTCHILITGSNARMLSGELATHLSGRHVAYHIHSLSYTEFLRFHAKTDSDDSLGEYLQHGGMPQLARIGLDDTELADDYLNSLIDTILLKDIVEREKIRNVPLLKALLAFVADNVGKQFSARNIVNFLKGQRVDTSANLVLTYLQLLCNAYVTDCVKRYDIHGKKIFELGDKYYFEDLGIRNHLVGGNRAADMEKVMENAVYLHLRRMGYEVFVGQLREVEIDFVARKGEATYYLQVTYLLASPQTIEREFGNLRMIRDSHPKYVVSLDTHLAPINDGGIRHIALRKFLLLEALP